MNPRITFVTLALLFGAPALGGCQSVYYETMEVFGKEKRDLLRSELRGMVDDQGEAQKTFTSALDKVKALTSFDGGDLERFYDELVDSYDDAESSADAIDGRVDEIETVATDLFAEWEEELALIHTIKLRSASEKRLRDTRRRFDTMDRSMRESRDQMRTVLGVLNDHVLYLKHNLNAAAVGALGDELGSVENSIEDLQETIEASIREAQSFLDGLE